MAVFLLTTVTHTHTHTHTHKLTESPAELSSSKAAIHFSNGIFMLPSHS